MLSSRLVTLVRYYIFWIILFAVNRAIFIVYNFEQLKRTPFSQVLMSFVKGLKLDLSMAGYIVFFASLLFALVFFVKGKLLSKIFQIYSFVILLIVSMITIGDCELYRNWGFRMDDSVLLYLKTPKEALASTKFWLMIVLFTSTFALTYFSFRLFKKKVVKNISKSAPDKWWMIFVYIFMCGLLFIPIRGSFGIAPINTGAVYFSSSPFANHAAVNVHWHLGNSLLHAKDTKIPHLIDDAEAKSIFDGMILENNVDSKLTNVENPNIIIIILESFSARIIEPLGGLADVTPNINSLCSKGVLYSNCLANGDRSDKGIVSILNGYPAQPKSSIIKNTAKTEKLPFLSKELNNLGYHTSFYYGGDINFANMRSYLISSRFNELISIDDFKAKYRNSKWGVHDHVVFNRFFDDCQRVETPFFKAFFTLSSHEPFDVPMKGPFLNDTEENKYLNSAYYTDSCLGDFIRKAENQTWWDSTLVFLVADHGGRYPGNVDYSSKEKFEIPLLILGGALNVVDTTIHSYVNQCDIPKIIGKQLNEDFESFTFSKNRTDSLNSFAFYAFNNGYGYFDNEGGYIYNLTSRDMIFESDSLSVASEKRGKAYFQTLMNSYFDNK